MPLVELLGKPGGGAGGASGAAQQSRAQRKAGYATLDAAARERQRQRHLAELDRDSYGDFKIELPREHAAVSLATRKGKGASSATAVSARKALASKKTLANYLDEAVAAGYVAPLAPSPSRYPARSFCAVCGHFGSYQCQRCGTHYCTIPCETTHKETGCHR